MIKRLKALLGEHQHFANYLGANFLTKILGFLSVPILTRMLTPEDYGIQAAYISYVGLFSIILTLNFHTAISRYYFEYKGDFEEFVANSIKLVGVAFLILTSIYSLLVVSGYRVVDLPNELVLIVPIAVFLNVLDLIFRQIYMPQSFSRQIAVRNILQTYLTFLTTVIAVYYLPQKKYQGVIGASLVVSLFFGFYYTKVIHRYTSWLRVKKDHIRYALNWTIPKLPDALSGVILFHIDRIMINFFNGGRDTGLYSFAASFGSIVTMVSSALYQSWVPKYMNMMNEKRYGEVDQDLLKILKLIVLTCSGVSIFSYELVKLLGTHEYVRTYSLISVIVACTIGEFFYYAYGRNISYLNKNWYTTGIVLVSGLTNLVLNYLLIKPFGYMVAAYNTAFSFCLMGFLAWVICKYVLKTHSPRFAPFFKVVIAYLFAVILQFSVITSVEQYMWVFLSKLVLFVAVAIYLYRELAEKWLRATIG